METIAQWLMNDYGVISLNIFWVLFGILFMFAYASLDLLENVILSVISAFLALFTLIFALYFIFSSDIFVGDKYATPAQKQKLSFCIEDYKKQNPDFQENSIFMIDNAASFCKKKKRIEEDRRKIESWK